MIQCAAVGALPYGSTMTDGTEAVEADWMTCNEPNSGQAEDQRCLRVRVSRGTTGEGCTYHLKQGLYSVIPNPIPLAVPEECMPESVARKNEANKSALVLDARMVHHRLTMAQKRANPKVESSSN